MLELWTNGLYKATPHWVKANLSKDRLSMPFFFDPSFETYIDIKGIVKNINQSKRTKWKLTSAAGDVEINNNSKKIRYGDYIRLPIK